MLTHQLKINDSETKLIILGIRQQLAKIDQNNSSIKVGNSIIKPSSSITILGIVFDRTMSLNFQINYFFAKTHTFN